MFRRQSRLTLQEIHRLYLLLKDCLPENEEQYLIDEIEGMIGRMKSGETLIRAVELMFPKKEVDARNPLELLLLFTKGLKQNDFFEYAFFINGIKRGKRAS